MTPQELRNSILQLAVQGKLVEQRPEEGTGLDLTNIIKSERDKAEKNGEIKRRKCFPEIKEDEIPFDIPENWVWIRLYDLAEACQTPFADGPFGSNLKSEHYTTKREVRIIQLSNIGENGWKNANTKYTTFEHLKTIERSEVQPGNIVIAKMMPAGRAIIVPEGEPKYVLSSDAVKFVPSHHLDKTFLYYMINSPVFRNQVYSEVHGITRVRTSLQKIQGYLIPLPPLSEQKRIVAKIEELLPYVERYEEAWNRLGELDKRFPGDLQKSVLQLAIQGKLVEQRPDEGTAEELFREIQREKQRLVKEGKIKKEKPLPEIKDDEIPFEIPDGWMWVRLCNFGMFSSGKTPSMSDPKNWNGNIPWISSKDMKSKFLFDSEMHITKVAADSMRIYPKGTLLLVARSGILRRLLPLCILAVDSTINQDIKAFSLYNNDISKWLFYSIKAFEPMILRNLVKSVTTVESLKFDEFSCMPIPLPPILEQKRIVAKIEELLPLCERLTQINA